jgi:hypothetical protein
VHLCRCCWWAVNTPADLGASTKDFSILNKLSICKSLWEPGVHKNKISTTHGSRLGKQTSSGTCWPLFRNIQLKETFSNNWFQRSPCRLCQIQHLSRQIGSSDPRQLSQELQSPARRHGQNRQRHSRQPFRLQNGMEYRFWKNEGNKINTKIQKFRQESFVGHPDTNLIWDKNLTTSSYNFPSCNDASKGWTSTTTNMDSAPQKSIAAH